MKKITVLSIQHTGTFFASATLAAAYPDSHLRIGSLYSKHRKLKHKRYIENGAIELSDFVEPGSVTKKTFFDRAVLSVCPPDDVKGKEIIIGHEHFHKADSWILNDLRKAPAGCPIVVPVRDPLLSLHSKIWREVEQHNNTAGLKVKHRKNRLEKWIELYKGILSIPHKHVFHLPIDAAQSQSKDTRIKLIKDMYKYCNIPFGERALGAAENWNPTNMTYKLITNEKKKTPAPRWENFKERYLQGDIKHTRAIMNLEFDTLHKDKQLIELMKKVGYQNVIWW